MTEMIRDVMNMEYGEYRYLGNGVIVYKKRRKDTRVEFNDVYNMLIDYGVDVSSDKVKETLDKINDFKKSKK